MIFSLVLVCLASCGIVTTIRAKHTDPTVAVKIPTSLPSDPFMISISAEFSLMAWFAEVVYRRELVTTGTVSTACDFLKNGDDPSIAGMPRPISEVASSKIIGWYRYRPVVANSSEDVDVESCVNDQGLFYETYVLYGDDGEINKAVIAFRGTENREGEAKMDWSTNISAALGREPTQYALARAKLPALISNLKKHSGIKIYAVGHSLGGGLAQQAGYLFTEIEAVYTFNTSPVTNWSQLRLTKVINTDDGTKTIGIIKNNYPTIYRVHHTGEGLQSVRNITTAFTSTRYNRYDIGVQLKPKSLGKGHSQSILACGLAKIYSQNNADSDSEKLGFYMSYIDSVVLEDSRCTWLQNLD